MKAIVKIKYTILISIGFFLMTISTQVNGQDEKHKARLSVDYIKLMGERSFIQVNAKYKPEKKYAPAVNLNLNVYERINEDSIALRGQVTTDSKGNAEYDVQLSASTSDSIITNEFILKIEDDSQFKNAKKAIKFQDVKLVAEAIVKDSVDYISATLTDATGNPIVDEKIELSLQRIFAPLKIGKYYKTDESGNILVSIEEPLPGVDGILTFEVVTESKSYGKVQYNLDAAIGKVVTDESTFDKRTMWSPPNKTPIFLLVFPNIIILGIWMVILLLVGNLYRIYKS